jgi:hypothetical protein
MPKHAVPRGSRVDTMCDEQSSIEQ